MSSFLWSKSSSLVNYGKLQEYKGLYYDENQKSFKKKTSVIRFIKS